MEVEPLNMHRPPATERDDGQWPARTRRLVDEVRILCGAWLHEPLVLCLGDFDRRLYEKSDRTRSHLDQQSYLATRKRLLQERQSFEAQFIAHIDRAFAQMDMVRAPSSSASPLLSLSLLDPLEHELTTALDQLVARNEARSGAQLVELSYRLAVLVGAPPLEAEALPVGPQAIAAAFRDASAALKLPSDHHLLLLQSLESTLVQGLAPLYEIINNHLLADGILPRLRAFPLPRSTPRPPRAASPVPPTPMAPPVEPVRSEADPAPVSLRKPVVPPRTENARGSGRVATAEELQTALLAVQQQLTTASGQTGRALCGAQALRDSLLAQLNAGQAAAAMHVRLGNEHDDAVELVVRWFVQLDRQLPPGDPAHALLGELQLPMLRMAMADRDFFDHRDHPAQQLLGKAFEAAHDWLDDGASEADRSLRGQLKQLLDRASGEPASSALYTSLLADIEHYLAQLTRKAQLTERRLVEAMQGHERLERARLRATELLAERFARSPPHGLLRGLLDHAWSDVLALTLLQHGEHSEAFADRIVITDQLLGRLPAGNRQKLQLAVETGLQQIGMSMEEAGQLALRLLSPNHDDAGAGLPSATDLAMRLKQRQRLGETSGRDTNQTDFSSSTPANPREQRIEQRLRELPFDSWFEFCDPATGLATRRKLAWYSTLSGRCLLVNRRGQRSDEMNLPQLANAIANGRARELPEETESPLDRAWHRVNESLRQPGSSGAPDAER